MKKFNVGLQLYSVRNTMAQDFEGTLTAVRDMGYEYVEFAGYYDKTGDEIKEVLDRLGLKCVSVHQRLEFFDDDPVGKINYLKSFGVKYVIVPWHDKDKLAGGSGWQATVENFTKYAKLFREHGMVLGYHNHDFEFETFEGKYLHDYLFEIIGKDLIVPEFDTCWVRYAGLQPEDKIREYKGFVDVVHLKDFTCKALGGGPVYDLITADGKDGGKKPTKEENGFEFRPVGMGIQDFKTILEACEESGTDLVIVEQDKTALGMSELESARASREYLKNTFGI